METGTTAIAASQHKHSNLGSRPPFSATTPGNASTVVLRSLANYKENSPPPFSRPTDLSERGLSPPFYFLFRLRLFSSVCRRRRRCPGPRPDSVKKGKKGGRGSLRVCRQRWGGREGLGGRLWGRQTKRRGREEKFFSPRSLS